VAAVRTASGKLPIVIGKPHRAMFDAALRGFDPLDAVMIGDSMATDILGAQRSGIASILVSGSDCDVGQEKEMRTPDFVISTLADLF
jgi:ribonucleotide monophosphatase NagD (HAD superfamily)